MKLTKEQKEILEIAKRKGNDADLFMLNKVNAEFKKLNDTVVKAFKALEDYKKKVKDYKDNIPDLGKYLKSVRGKEGKVGERGERGESIRGKDGKDANEEKIIKKVIKKIPIPKDGITPIKGIDYFDGINGKDGVGTNGADGSPDTSEVIRDKLELLNGEERFDISFIKGLRRKLTKLEERPLGKSGGIGDANMKFGIGRLVKNETPNGTINGTNKVYTVENSVHAILSFGINGMVIHDNEYTISGKTITFTNAIPAGASGSTFRIVYI